MGVLTYPCVLHCLTLLVKGRPDVNLWGISSCMSVAGEVSAIVLHRIHYMNMTWLWSVCSDLLLFGILANITRPILLHVHFSIVLINQHHLCAVSLAMVFNGNCIQLKIVANAPGMEEDLHIINVSVIPKCLRYQYHFPFGMHAVRAVHINGSNM